jgi:hypothetical protein
MQLTKIQWFRNEPMKNSGEASGEGYLFKLVTSGSTVMAVVLDYQGNFALKDLAVIQAVLPTPVEPPKSAATPAAVPQKVGASATKK